MRPAIEVAYDIAPDPGFRSIAALIQRDREELVREIYEWVRFKGHPYAAEEIERKFLKGADDGRGA